MNQPDTLFQTRYGDAAARAPAAWSPVIEHLLGHRSVRAYLPDPVSEDELVAIVAAAQSAASSSNLQAWSVVAVRDPATRAALAECAGGQAHVRDAPLQLVWLADLARLEHLALANERPSAALDYLEMFLVGVIDAALAAQNAAAAAESLGLATVYIGGMRNQPERVAELLRLPSKVVAVFGMCVGRPDPAQPAEIKPRPPQSVVLHHETYTPLPAQDEGIAAYNGAMAQFYERQNMKVHGTWAVHSAKRVAGPESLSGRDRLVEALHNRGFTLK
ncbi:NADPH-dependent oxidoreductase [Azoarcus olearius]|uniref:Oxygen-insentive NADPH nitroreductase n=1 Tax=Azoarcus sp. (strain BH72) TaxID=418699 RepID=A1K415_AZOSB|nr:NADPH-dependent oxidoreductase [Azoarcus olearius]ANQ84092.1 putative oxygen-insentive NADPH nitroreductase [Azoarcus olearius]CAL93570.1 putative oxygen-insentive NADPH nitroreductase [Azoarcus olearius]